MKNILLDAIIFDFDGVIAESVDVKTKAFRELFRQCPDKLKEITRYHLDNGGISRFEKFRYIYKNILNKTLTPADFRRLCRSFENLVVNDVVKAPLVKGIRGFLDRYKGTMPFFVISATPDKEIKQIVKRKGLLSYFEDVFGAPVPKDESIKRIVKENNFDPNRVLFIGDSINDYHAAQKTRVLFAFRMLENNCGKTEHIDAIARFKDFVDLQRRVAFHKDRSGR